MDFIGFIIIGIIAGWIAEKVMKRDHGLLTNLLVGAGGAILGGLIAGLLGLHAYGFIARLLVATAGAVLLLVILGVIKRRRA